MKQLFALLFIIVLASGCTTGDVAREAANTSDSQPSVQLVSDQGHYENTCQDSFKACSPNLTISCHNIYSEGKCTECKPNCARYMQQSLPQQTSQQSQQPAAANQNQQNTQQPSQPLPDIKITYIEYDPPGNDRENMNGEYVKIEGSGTLTSWTLSDAANHVFTFSTFQLSGSVLVHTGSGANNQSDLYWNSGSPIWNNDADMAILKNQNGDVMDEYSY